MCQMYPKEKVSVCTTDYVMSLLCLLTSRRRRLVYAPLFSSIKSLMRLTRLLGWTRKCFSRQTCHLKSQTFLCLDHLALARRMQTKLSFFVMFLRLLFLWVTCSFLTYSRTSFQIKEHHFKMEYMYMNIIVHEHRCTCG